MTFDTYLKLKEAGKLQHTQVAFKPIKEEYSSEEQTLLNKLKVPKLSKGEQVYLNAVNILRRKKQERIEEMNTIDDELELMELREAAPKEPLQDVDGYFQKIMDLADDVANDIEAEHKLSSEINIHTIRELANKERLFSDNPDTLTAKEFYCFRKVFIKYLGVNPTRSALNKMFKQGFTASKHRMQESTFQKALALVQGKSFKRLMSECKLKTGKEDSITEFQLKPLIKIEQSQALDIKATRILNFKEFHEQF